MIICFYGLPRSGKDTAADHLATTHKLHRVAFAAGIYEEVSKAFGVTVEQLASHEWKTEPQAALALENCTNWDFNDVVFQEEARSASARSFSDIDTTPRTSRFILQRWATEYRRVQDPLYWVKRLDETLKGKIAKDGLRDIVISDLREFHEYQYVRNLSSELFTTLWVIEVRRAGTFSNGHSSDNALPRWCIDAVVDNCDIQEFKKEIERVVDAAMER